jgi:hypothetical protein
VQTKFWKKINSGARYIPRIPVAWEADAEGSQVQDQPRQHRETLSQNKIEKGQGYISVVEQLPSMGEALESIPRTASHPSTMK